MRQARPGVPIAATLGAQAHLRDVVVSLFGPADTGHPIARLAARGARAVHLALVGGATSDSVVSHAPGASGAQLFEDNCAMCHGRDANVPFQARGRDAATFHELLSRLPAIDNAMPPFEGTENERRALAAHLVTLQLPRRGGNQ